MPDLLVDVTAGTLDDQSAEWLRSGGFRGVMGDRAGWMGPRTLCASIADPADLSGWAPRWADRGYELVVLRLGHFLYDDDALDAAAEHLLQAAQDAGLPLYLETRRGTMTQDIVRTVQLVERYPELRFSLDFAEWFVGHELMFGNMGAALARLDPVWGRVRLIKGRVGTWECDVVDVGEGSALPATGYTENAVRLALRQHRTVWTRVMTSFLRTAPAAAPLGFTVDLEDADVSGSDRFEQALVLAGIGRECWTSARASLSDLFSPR